MTFVEPLLFFVLALSLLVLVHEWGHYWVARRAGVRVLRFSIGFGPELLGRTSGDTRWSICAIPFGGYVKFAGDNPEEPRDAAPDEFLSQRVGVRSAIVLAGPAMNYALAVLLYAAVIWADGERVFPEPRIGGVEEGSVAAKIGLAADDVIRSVNGKPVENWLDTDARFSEVGPGGRVQIEVMRDGGPVVLAGALAEEANAPEGFGISFFVEPVVGGVKRGSPAWVAGLREGDRIVSVDGQAVDRWSELQELVSERPDREVSLVYERDGVTESASVTPEGEEIAEADGGNKVVGRIGIVQPVERKSIGPLAALAGGFRETWTLTRGVLELIPRLPVMIFNALFRGEDDGGLGGPVRMAQLFGEAARWGVLSFLSLLAFISTQLAVFNLLPIPVLDGGHLALYLVEIVTRRPPSIRVRVILQQIGFAILVLLMLSVTVMDVGRMFG
ncbi:MAG: RIP metalloprotease RseP [Candidatus Eiseniibacteriota bacterium]